MVRSERIKMASLRSDLAAVIGRVTEMDRFVIVTRHSEPVAALISLHDLNVLRRMYITAKRHALPK